MHIEVKASSIEPPSVPISQRERAKAQRRARIVECAMELLREESTTELSVQLIADRAGVNPGTVYNLFGNRGEVLKRVYDEDLRRFRSLVEQKTSEDALERMFDAMAIAAKLYEAEPMFYRPVAWGRNVRPGTEEAGIIAAVTEPRTEFWASLIEVAVAETHLLASTPVRPLAVLVTRASGGALAAWIGGLIDLKQLEAEMMCGLAAILSCYASASAEPRLRRKMELFVDRLEARPA